VCGEVGLTFGRRCEWRRPFGRRGLRVIDVNMTSIHRSRGSQRHSFARTGHRTPLSFAGDNHSDDWRDETLKAMVLEMAALKARFALDEAADGGSGCECVALRRRVSQLERENAALRAAQKQQQQQAPRDSERPASRRVDKWRPSDSTPLLREYFSCRRQPWQSERGQCRLRVEKGDIVTADEMWKLHFVSADLRRSKGVALRLAEVFGPVDVRGEGAVGVGMVKMQRLEQGGLVTHLLNLVTKRKYFHKPAANPERFLADIAAALQSLRDYCEHMHIRRLALPRVGSNLDRVHWRWTQQKLLEAFEDLDIELVVYLGDRRPRQARRTPPVNGQPPALKQPPDGSSRTEFPPLKDPKERAMRPVGRQAGLHKGDGADACGGSVLAGRPEASVIEPPALPEVDNSANDGASASAQPSSLSQVSLSAAPTLHFAATANLEHQLNQPLVLPPHVADRDAAEDALSPSPLVDENSSADDVERLLLSPARSQPVVVLHQLNLKDVSSSQQAQQSGQTFP
jgi:hypothetical protein